MPTDHHYFHVSHSQTSSYTPTPTEQDACLLIQFERIDTKLV